MVIYGLPFIGRSKYTRVMTWSRVSRRSRGLTGDERRGGKNQRRKYNGCNYHEGAAGSRGTLRAPGQAVEPKDEEVYLRRAERDLHHRSPENAQAVQGSL